MVEDNLKKMAQKIETLKREVTELKEMSGGIQAIDRNADRILASIKMLEINISDLADII
jgi:hypothetical protein